MPKPLPPDLAPHYRPATDNDIRNESFGLLQSAQVHADTNWQHHRRTFDDQAIFGPRTPFACACGKYDGCQYADIICDRCGVKVTTPAVRHSRCAHINLPTTVQHPLGTAQDQLTTLPVLPAAFVEAPAGRALLQAYDEILRAPDAPALSNAFERLLDVMLPALVIAHRWDLTDRQLVAHGMALKQRLL